MEDSCCHEGWKGMLCGEMFWVESQWQFLCIDSAQPALGVHPHRWPSLGGTRYSTPDLFKTWFLSGSDLHSMGMAGCEGMTCAFQCGGQGFSRNSKFMGHLLLCRNFLDSFLVHIQCVRGSGEFEEVPRMRGGAVTVTGTSLGFKFGLRNFNIASLLISSLAAASHLAFSFKQILVPQWRSSRFAMPTEPSSIVLPQTGQTAAVGVAIVCFECALRFVCQSEGEGTENQHPNTNVLWLAGG